MHSGRDSWKTAATPAERAQAVADILHLLSHSQPQIRIFASVVEKRLFADKSKIIPTAFQDIAFSFDTSLRNIYYKHNNAQRGLVLFDKSTSERMIQELSYSYKHLGSSDDKLRNFAKVPVFVDSQATIADSTSFNRIFGATARKYWACTNIFLMKRTSV